MNSQAAKVGSINDCIQALNKGNTQLKILSLKKVQAEKAYRVKMSQAIIKLKGENYPVTLILELVKGVEEVAELRMQRDIAVDDYKNCENAMENLRIEIEARNNKLLWLTTEMANF